MAMLCLSAVSLVSAVHEQWPVAGGIGTSVCWRRGCRRPAGRAQSTHSSCNPVARHAVVASGVKEVPPSGETSVRVLVRFDDGVFSLKPHVAVTSLTFADGSPAGITEDQLSVQPDYFTVGFIDTKAWTRPFNFTWTATLQGKLQG